MTSKQQQQHKMKNNNESDESEDQNMNLEDSQGMNENQQALFLNISRSKSADSFIGKLLPNINDVADRDRSLVFQHLGFGITNNIILSQPNGNFQQSQKNQYAQTHQTGGLHVFKKIKKEKVKGKCDYDKNICGYITKKVIREFLGKSYEAQVRELTTKYKCSYAECKSYYIKQVQRITGPSHLPKLLEYLPQQPQSIKNCKKAFRQFYRWFLKERYVRYLLLEGKMTNKQAYIEYKNNNLFKYVEKSQEEEQEIQQQEIRQLQTQMRTRSRSGVKLEQ